MSDVIYYTAPINIRQSDTSAANSTVWAMRNDSGSTKTIFIEYIKLNLSFDAVTPVTRSLQRYDFVRFTTATPTGGNSITAIPWQSFNPSSQVTDIRYLDTGLSTTSVSFGTPIFTVGIPATDSAIAPFESANIPVVLAPGEGLCFRLTNTAVIGQGMTGFISWSEK